jgi:HEAT repeat protein
MRLLLALALLLSPAAAADLVDRLGAEDSNDVIAACREAAASEDPALTAPLVRLLKHDNSAVRRAAIEALGLRKPAEEKKRAAQALAQRIAPLVAQPAAKEECLTLLAALHDLAQPVALKPLLHAIEPDADQEVARARLRAAANIPRNEVIDELLQVGSAGRRGGAQWRVMAAIEALRYATQAKVKGGIDEWRHWWTENKATFDADLAANQRADARLREQAKAGRRKKK